jgi:hypothetical protein
VLDKYDVPKWIVDDVLSNAPRLREEATGALSRRQYDAAGRGSVLLRRPDGTITRLHLPLHVTQQADLLPLVDTKELERAAQAVKGWDWESGVRTRCATSTRSARLGVSGTKGRRRSRWPCDVPAEALELFYSLWRPATLLRVGWPVRILMDEQLRILSKIGAMSHGATARGRCGRQHQAAVDAMGVPDRRRREGRRARPPDVRGGDIPSRSPPGSVRAAVGDYETTLKLRSGQTVTLPPAFGTPGDAAQVFKRLNSSSGAFRELAVREEDALLKSFRKHTGSWTSFTPDHGDYPAIWTQTVNRQLKQSAFARQFLAGASVDDAPVAREDRRGHRLRARDGLAAGLVPASRRRRRRSGRPLRADTGAPLEAARGEDHARRSGARCARSDGPSGGARRGARPGARPVRDLEGCAERARRLFKWLGQVPTDVLSRNPFFDSMYRMEAERLANLADDGARQAGRLLGEEDLADIASKARRFALNQSQDLLYDLAEKSHLAHMLRFVAPFYMAWQEVLTRWAGIAVDNPAFVARMRQVWDAPEKAGIVSDEHGRVVDEHGRRPIR